MSGNGHGNGHAPAKGGYFLETELAWGQHATARPWPGA